MKTSYERLLKANEQVKGRYVERRAQWSGSPFEWLIRLPSRTVGAVGEALVEEWLKAEGFELTRSRSSEFDRWCQLKGGRKRIRLEIKFSTLWENGTYRFQQIRDQQYDALLCLGLSPNSAHAWAIPKDEAWARASGQHGGRQGRDTKWLHIDPNEIPDWLSTYGGELKQAVAQLRKMLDKESSAPTV